MDREKTSSSTLFLSKSSLPGGRSVFLVSASEGLDRIIYSCEDVFWGCSSLEVALVMVGCLDFGKRYDVSDERQIKNRVSGHMTIL